MKIGMQTWGSHGDIRPFLALAEGLQLAGHEVSLLITCVDGAAYDGMVSRHGVNIRVIASPVITPEEAEKIGQAAFNTRNPMAQMAAILRLCFAPAEDAMFAAAQDLCAESELLIGHYFMHPLQIAAERAGKPYVSVLLSHAAVPSAFNHPIGLPLLGHIGNRILWWLTKAAINRAVRPYPNRLRKLLNMQPAGDIVTEVWISQLLTLVAVSPQICQRQPDWPSWINVCGFLDMPNLPLEGSVPETLASFLAAGTEPVYMTFGSWMPRDVASQSETLQLLTQAATLAGCRAIIQSPGWRECGFVSDAHILRLGRAPPCDFPLVPGSGASWRRRHDAIGDARGQAVRRGGAHQRAGTLGQRIAAHRHRRQAGKAPRPDRQALERAAQIFTRPAGTENKSRRHRRGDGARKWRGGGGRIDRAEIESPRVGRLSALWHHDRFGASQRSSSASSTPRRAAMSLSWSSPILPTTKYFDSGCAK